MQGCKRLISFLPNLQVELDGSSKLYALLNQRFKIKQYPNAFVWDPEYIRHARTPEKTGIRERRGRFLPLPYSEKVGRPMPTPEPYYEAVRNDEVAGKWKRSVLRFPPGVASQLFGRTLLISGKAGIVRVDLDKIDPTGLVGARYCPLDSALQTVPSTAAPSALMMLASLNAEASQTVTERLQSCIKGANQGYLVGMYVKGVGYRVEPVEPDVLERVRIAGGGGTGYFYDHAKYEQSNVVYPVKKPYNALRLKIGFTNTVVYPLPPDMRVFFVKTTTFYLYGLDKPRLDRVAAHIRSLRKPDSYTGQGIARLDEVVKKVARKNKK